MSVPTNLIPTKVTGLPEYTGSGTYGYMPYVIDGRTYKVQFSNIAAVGAVPSSRTIATGTGLTGGGDLSQDRTIAIAPEGVSFDQLAPSGVVAGVYGSGTAIPVVTVDAKGRVTSATTTPLSISGYVPTSRSVFAGTGLTGGGDLASDVTLAVNFSDNNPQALGTATAGVSTAAARGDHVHPAVDLSDTSQTQGALPLGRGGTGDAISPVAGAVVYSTGTKFALTNPGIAGQVLMSNGVDEPVWATVSGTGTVTSVNASGGTTGLTFTGGPVTTAGTLTLGGTLAVTHGGTGATDAATARSNLGAAASGANSDITSMSGITGAIATPDYIDFDTAATVSRATGRLWWDNADGNQTLSLGMAGGNATLQIGEEMYFRIKASSAITEGQAVMFTGTLGASGGLTGAPATGLTKDTASYLMGVATEDIPLNSWGYVTQFGLVRGFNTTGGAEAWVDGQILYYNPAVPGGLTKTVPTAPAAKIEVAAVVHAASNGSVFVRPTARFSLTQLNDVETSAAADLDLLQYNGTSGVWQHKSPSLISVGSATNLAGGAANRIAYQTGAGATGFVVAPTVANTYLEWSGSTFQWSANPLGTVTSVNASGGTTGLTFTGGPVTTAGTLTLGGTLGVANGGTGATSLTSGYLLKGNGTSAVSSSVIYDDGTNVGIGTASPSTKLTVSSSGVMSRFQTGAATDGRIEFAYNTTDIGYLNMASATQLELYGRSGVALAFGAGGSERMRIDSSGNVGIGTSSPGVKLDVNGVIRSNAWTFITPNTSTDNALYRASNTGGTIYMGLDNSAGGLSGAAYALSLYHSGAYPIVFSTNNSERMRITSAGFVGIGTGSPSSKLTVLDGDIEVNATGLGNTLLSFNGTTANLTVNSSSAPLIFGTNSTERMRIDTSGNVGIGLTPSHALDVYSAANGIIRVGGGSGTNQGAAYYVKNANNSNTLAAFGDRARIFGGTPDQLVSIFTSALPLTFDVNGSERMRIDSSGNVGIGVTPSASDLPTIQSTYGIISGNAQINIAQNAYYSSGWKYTGTAAATLYFQGSGAHNWQIAASGTAGAAISFTQAMTLDTSGNLGIGTTSPSQRIDATVSSGTEGVGLGVTNSLAGGYGSGINFYSFRTDGTTKLTAGAIQMYGQSNWADATNTSSSMRFYTVGNNTLGERMRITAEGNVLINRSSASGLGKLNVDGGADFTGGNVLLCRDTGNVGIGTSSPGAKLAVDTVGTAGVGLIVQASSLTASQINMGIGVITAGRPFIGTNTSTNPLEFGVRDATDVIFVTGAAEKMRLTSGGDLLIGTTTSQGKLSVNSATGNVGFNTGTSSSPERGNLWYDTDGTGWKFNIGKRQSGTFTAQMTIQDDGNVGIGTTSPSTILHVAGSSVTEVRVTSSGNLTTGAASLLRFGGSNSATSGYIGYGGTASTIDLWNTLAGSLTFGTSNLERMRIDSSGNVGIGTSSPGVKLEVNGAIAFGTSMTSGVGVTTQDCSFELGGNRGGDGNAYIDLHATSGTDYETRILRSGGANGALDIVNTGTGIFTLNASGAAAMRFATSNTERMRIDASGDVGIGTSSSYAVLSDRTLFVAGSSYASLNLVCGGAYGGAGMTVDSSTNLQIRNAGAERMRIDSSGNVSLGGVAPGTRLDVYSSATDTITAVRNSSVGLRIAAGSTFAGVNAGSVYTTNSVPLVLGTGGSERMRVDTSGNVGIGLTSYSSKLTVAGTIESTTGGIKFPDATTQTTKGIAAAWAQITSITTTSGTTAIFSNIPQTYTALRFAIVGVSHNGGTNGSIRMSVSSDGVTYSAAWNLGASIAAAATIDGALQGDSYTQDTCFFIGDAISSANASPYVSVNGTYFMFKVTGGVKYVKFEWSQGASFDAGSITLYGR